MPYIGNTPADKFLTLAKQSFSTSATTSYTLDSAVSSTQDIALFINSVRQSPVDAYSVSGTALTLTSATAGTDEMYCVYLGKTVGTVSPASDSIATAMIQANAVTGAKLNTDVISAQTDLGATPADTDELLVSDAGVLKRVDYSHIKGLGKIGQVVNAIDSTVDTFTSNTLTAASCTASITPSATSSKILVLYNAPVLMSGTANSYAEMRLFRDTTELKIFTDIGAYNGASQVATQTFHYDFLDTPSSTSSLTFSVKYAEHGSSTININNSSGSGGAGSSTMTLLEVLA